MLSCSGHMIKPLCSTVYTRKNAIVDIFYFSQLDAIFKLFHLSSSVAQSSNSSVLFQKSCDSAKTKVSNPS